MNRKYLKQRIAENKAQIEVLKKENKIDEINELENQNIMFHEKIKDLKESEL